MTDSSGAGEGAGAGGGRPSLLVAIPHFYNPAGSGRHGSTRANDAARANALRQAILNLWANLAGPTAVLDIAQRKAVPGPVGVDLTIAVVTTGGKHLIPALNLPSSLFRHVEVDLDDPMYLGFECHRVLAESLSRHDWFGFIEDDLLVQDPQFLRKLAWFGESFGDAAVLQPNRYEWQAGGPLARLYIDGPLRPQVIDRFVRPGAPERLSAWTPGGALAFQRAANPHSGAFFLTRNQMRRWVESPWFLDRDASFISPLESAATLGLLKTFFVYKTLSEHSDFLQIEHAGRGFIGMVGHSIPLA